MILFDIFRFKLEKRKFAGDKTIARCSVELKVVQIVLGQKSCLFRIGIYHVHILNTFITKLVI